VDRNEETELLETVARIEERLANKCDKYDEQLKKNEEAHNTLFDKVDKTNNRINAMIGTASVLAVTTCVAVILFLAERMSG